MCFGSTANTNYNLPTSLRKREKRNRTAGEPRFQITFKIILPVFLTLAILGATGEGGMFECECMYMRFSAKVVLAEGQGRRERWGIKAGGIFVSRQGLCFPWVICKCMDQIKTQVGLIIFSNYTCLN